MKQISFYKQSINPNWCVEKTEYLVEEEANEETLFTLSNGFMGVRGALELASAKKQPATFIAGLFDKKEKEESYKGRGYVKNKALTPAYAIIPDSNLISIKANGVDFDFINSRLHGFKRVLDMQHGILFNDYIIENPEGKIIALKAMSLVSKTNKHLALYQIEVTPLNFSGELVITFKNNLCAFPQVIRRLKDYVCKTDLVSLEYDMGVCRLNAEISETKEKIILLAKTLGDGEKLALKEQNGINEAFKIVAKQDKAYTFQKRTAIFSSRDAMEKVALPDNDMDGLIEAHINAWVKDWHLSNIEIHGDDEIQIGVRWNIFNLLQLANPNNPDVSISATGLHGQGYFGHAFWDTEIFLIPFYIAVMPNTAKSLLLYRYRRLNEARNMASKDGFLGARFPWTSTYTGVDVTPPDWADSSKLEIHISGAVAYAMNNYYIQTGDIEFYKNYGIETIIETAKYYASIARVDNDGKYHILNITGPDEYNICVNDNYYTNYLAQWNMKEALLIMESMKTTDKDCYERIKSITSFDEKTINLLENVSANLAFPKARDNVLEQFDGFFKLKDTGGFERDEDGMPIDRRRVFDSGLQELKQPDVVMLHYLFPDSFSKEIERESFSYYEKRCKHGSSLSPSIHCIVGLRNGFYERAYSYLRLTALMDLKNLHLDKNLYEGIHIACAGGTWAGLVYGFGGVLFKRDEIHINPYLPSKWSGLSFSFLNKGIVYKVRISKKSFSVCADKDAFIFIKGRKEALKENEICEFAI